MPVAKVAVALGARLWRMGMRDRAAAIVRSATHAMADCNSRLGVLASANAEISTTGLRQGLASILLAPPAASAAGVREDHPNLVDGEMLGRGFVNQATRGSGGGFVVWPGITIGGSF